MTTELGKLDEGNLYISRNATLAGLGPYFVMEHYGDYSYTVGFHTHDELMVYIRERGIGREDVPGVKEGPKDDGRGTAATGVPSEPTRD